MRVPVIFRQMRAWPVSIPATPPEDRQKSRFKATWLDTLGLLDHELAQLAAEMVTLDVECATRDVRRDGFIRADANVVNPGIILRFEDAFDRQLMYPCDRFNDWQDNVRAVALSLAALRAVDRYGVTTKGEQYAGFKAIPASTGATLDTQSAAILVGVKSGVTKDGVLADREVARTALRKAAARTHPDAGGNPHEFNLVQDAKKVLEAHFGGPL